MDQSKISVYITCYNLEQYIGNCIESVINQSINIHEIIIIDDHSTDNSKKVITSFHKRYPSLIRPVFNESNLGISKNRNLAILMCTGNYLAGIDGDDIWMPYKLEVEYKGILKYKADFSFSLHKRFRGKCEIENLMTSNIQYLDLTKLELHEKTVLRKFGQSLFRSELVRIDAYKDVGGYDENLNLYEDYDFKLRLTAEYRGIGVDVITEGYRINDDGLSKTTSLQHFKSLNYIFEKYKGATKDKLPKHYLKTFNNRLNNELLNALLSKEISFLDFIKHYKFRKASLSSNSRKLAYTFKKKFFK